MCVYLLSVFRSVFVSFCLFIFLVICQSFAPLHLFYSLPVHLYTHLSLSVFPTAFLPLTPLFHYDSLCPFFLSLSFFPLFVFVCLCLSFSLSVSLPVCLFLLLSVYLPLFSFSLSLSVFLPAFVCLSVFLVSAPPLHSFCFDECVMCSRVMSVSKRNEGDE